MIEEMSPEDIFLPYHSEFYKVSIDEAVRSAVAAFIDYGSAADDGTIDDAARHLQDALGYCAALSRYFWPPTSAGALGKYRGEQIKQVYGINDESPLANRNLRNALEHFDERLDDWLKKGPVGPIVASAVFGDHSEIEEDFGHIFKMIDAEKSVFVVLGQKFEFGPLSQEVARLMVEENFEDGILQK
jgi:hypothetical protein